jgi:hypothetical protein
MHHLKQESDQPSTASPTSPTYPVVDEMLDKYEHMYMKLGLPSEHLETGEDALHPSSTSKTLTRASSKRKKRERLGKKWHQL